MQLATCRAVVTPIGRRVARPKPLRPADAGVCGWGVPCAALCAQGPSAAGHLLSADWPNHRRRGTRGGASVWRPPEGVEARPGTAVCCRPLRPSSIGTSACRTACAVVVVPARVCTCILAPVAAVARFLFWFPSLLFPPPALSWRTRGPAHIILSIPCPNHHRLRGGDGWVRRQPGTRHHAVAAVGAAPGRLHRFERTVGTERVHRGAEAGLCCFLPECAFFPCLPCVLYRT